MTMKYDFHFHSTFSDGSDTIENIFHRAKEQGLAALALTDHDTVLGIPRAVASAKRHGIACIPAGEFSAVEEGIKFHLLGYGLDWESRELTAYSQELLDCMNARSRRQIARLQRDGIDIAEQEYFARAGGGPLYRAKLLGVLADFGYLERENIMKLLPKYFGKDMPYYEPDDFCYRTFDQLCEMIRRNGGKTVLAHPEKIRKKSETLYHRLLESPLLDGVEVYHPDNPPETREELLTTAKRRGLIYTGGSDYHGQYMKHPLELGDVDIPDECYGFLRDYTI